MFCTKRRYDLVFSSSTSNFYDYFFPCVFFLHLSLFFFLCGDLSSRSSRNVTGPRSGACVFGLPLSLSFFCDRFSNSEAKKRERVQKKNEEKPPSCCSSGVCTRTQAQAQTHALPSHPTHPPSPLHIHKMRKHHACLAIALRSLFSVASVALAAWHRTRANDVHKKGRLSFHMFLTFSLFLPPPPPPVRKTTRTAKTQSKAKKQSKKKYGQKKQETSKKKIVFFGTMKYATPPPPPPLTRAALIMARLRRGEGGEGE